MIVFIILGDDYKISNDLSSTQNPIDLMIILSMD